MVTTTEPMTDAELLFLLRAPLVCLSQCSAEESQVCESLRSCRHYGLKRQALRVPTPWATSTDLHASDAQKAALKAALQASDVSDPLVPDPWQPVTGPSIRGALWPLTRRERVLGWVVSTAVRDPWALVCYLVSLLAVSYVLWHLAAAITEGRLRL